MRVIYDRDTGRVATVGDAVEPGEGQAATELTPDESAALAETATAVESLTAQLRTAVAAHQEAAAVYGVAADAVKQAFVAADAAAHEAGGRVGFDARKREFVTIAAAPAPDPTPEEDEALVLGNPALAALARYLERKQGKG